MRTIHRSFNAILSHAVCVSAFVGFTSAALAQSLPWPNTFVGQADFEFVRQDVINEIEKKRAGDATHYIATLDDILTARTVDPFVPTPTTSDIGRSKYSKKSFDERMGKLDNPNKPLEEAFPNAKQGQIIQVIRADGDKVEARIEEGSQVTLKDKTETFRVEVTPTGDIVEYVPPQTEDNRFDKLFSAGAFLSPEDFGEGGEAEEVTNLPEYTPVITTLPDLPNISDQARVDLSEFATFLDNIIRQTTRAAKAGLKDLNFNQHLDKLTLQSIVTSPVKYAIINNHRFSVGDRFMLPVKMKAEAPKGLEERIDAYMPSPTSTPEEVYAQYVHLKNEAIRQYKERIGATDDENSDGNAHNVSVTVKDIVSRKVVLDIYGAHYTLNMKLAL